ncbi:MAG: hypothetical protein RLZZ84_2326 [Pseudomonadota bacterium]|jgi:LacI family transcriptional regulator
MSTIVDVAARAGVSIKTVSKVLAGADTVRPKLKTRILAAMEELDYRPALAARQLASGRSYIVALLVPRLVGSYFATLVMEVSRACARRGYHAIVESFDDSDDLLAEAALRLSCNPDAIVVAPPLSNNARLLDRLEQLGLPFARIAAASDAPGIPVRVEGRDAARGVVEHLIAQGHRRIAMLAPPGEASPSDDRRLGHGDALAAAGIAGDPALVVRTDFSFSGGARAMRGLMALKDRPTAIFCGNDLTALGALAMAQSLGLAVPDDVAIAGFDNSPESRQVFPPLTTVDQPIAAIATAAVDAALGRDGPIPVFRHELIVRGSTSGVRAVCLDEEGADAFVALSR